MSFDNKEYLDILNEFICKSKDIKRFNANAIKPVITPVCEHLRIAKFTSALYETVADPALSGDGSHIYFDGGNADEARYITAEANAFNKGVCRYRIYQKQGDPDWNEEELQLIRSFQDLMFIFTERAFLLKTLQEMPVKDDDMGVYSLPFLIATIKSVIDQGRIGDFGIVYFNIRRLSALNENLGREKANNAMKAFIQGIQKELLFEECVCRLGGDNFVMLFRRERTEKLRSYLSGTPVFYGSGNETVNISTCAGFYLIPETVENPSEIVDSACTAYQLAKNVYKRPYIFYNEDIMKRQKHIKMIENAFPSAIANEEFKVFYQPKTQLNNYMIAGAEALCRWFRDGRIIPPNDFIPVLEGSKAICTLDFYMLEHVCRDIRRWLDEGRDVVKVSVNLSRVHLGDDDLLETIIGIVDKHRVPHELIEIELTETTTDVDFKELKDIVNGLHEQNISTSVDDFGMGYSSLNLIRELPWNVLKIDKSFLPTQAENQDPSKLKMLRHIISMSQDLGLECVVEGVETAEQVKLLRDCKCFLAQGFYFDKPLPVEEFEQRLDGISAC